MCTFEQQVTIDEGFLLNKGRLGWIQYIPLKRARFGIKTYLLCEFKNGYIYNSITYICKTTLIWHRLVFNISTIFCFHMLISVCSLRRKPVILCLLISKASNKLILLNFLSICIISKFGSTYNRSSNCIIEYFGGLFLNITTSLNSHYISIILNSFEPLV